MIGGRVARHTLTRRRPDRVSNGHGGEENDWESPDDVAIPGWAVDAGSTLEDLQNRDGAMTEYTVRGPFNADVLPGDRMLLPWSTDPYEVDGDVLRQPGPSSATSHCIVRLKRWAG